jgi:hypothetical protein
MRVMAMLSGAASNTLRSISSPSRRRRSANSRLAMIVARCASASAKS